MLSVQSPLSGRLTVAVMTPGHYIDGFERTYTDCPWRDRHIACDFLNATDPFIWLRAGAYKMLTTHTFVRCCAPRALVRGALSLHIESLEWLRAGELPCRKSFRNCGRSLAE